MSTLGDALGRNRRSQQSGSLQPTAGSPAPASEAAVDAGDSRGLAQRDDRGELRRRRDALAEQVTELHWDLGGLAYEMAIRDHFRLDVLVRRAAVLQERDAELAELERLLRLEDSASAGGCPVCGAPHSRGAVYCWQCGATLMQRVASSAGATHAPTSAQADEQPAAALDALLAPDGAYRAGEDGSHDPFGRE
ncbi:MAG TPA: hypothetical protein VK761_02705 [Solirubrobacteraceae bacterium]|nr:hypothetical protein [Solirubrobacteraceae bacterium]